MPQKRTELFGAPFKVRDVFSASMIRLHGVHIKLADLRLLTTTARLSVEVEATILWAIGAIRLS